MIKAVLFDYGGVMCESEMNGPLVSEEVARHLRLDHELTQPQIARVTSEYIRGKLANHGAYWRGLARELELEMAEETDAVWMDSELLKPFPKMQTFVRELRGRGLRVGILSNVFPHSRDIIREHGGYDGFDPVILSCEAGYAKPDPEMYERALEVLELPAGEVLFIDDKERMLEPARELGMAVVRADSVEQVMRDVRAALT